jgi:predicted thioesterase
MIEPGAVGEVTLVVGDADTAIAYASGDVAVLATPRVLALAEQAAVTALADELAADQTSVGIHAELYHLKATRPGATVTARTKVVSVDGRTIVFEFHVTEADQMVAQGTHQRVIVARSRFR